MSKKALSLGILLVLTFYSMAQTVSIRADIRNDCVGGVNKYSITGGVNVTAWIINGSYSDLVTAPDDSWIQFEWTSSGSFNIEVYYQGTGCGGPCVRDTPPTNVYKVTTPLATITRTPSSSITYGTLVTFNATATNAGNPPTYQWYLNNVLQPGETTSQYKNSTLQNGDKVYCKVTSTLPCASPTYDDSNIITMSVSYPISNPTVSPVTATFNQPVTLTASGAGTNEVYRWYEQPTGDNSNYYQGLSYPQTFLDHKTLYVSKKNTATGAESGRVPQAVTVVVSPPAVPVLSTNTCGSRTLTRGTPPSQVIWCWQGTDENGAVAGNFSQTYTINDASNVVYYLRAKASTANIWSQPVGIKVTTDPVDIEVDRYQSANYLIQATHSIRLTDGFVVTAGNQMIARIAITPECNNIYNWSEQIVYDQNAQPVTRSRVYTDGMGNEIQSQSIDSKGKVWASQPLYDNSNIPSAQTLAAPILEHDFIYKPKFVLNSSENVYGPNDFDKSITTSNLPGEIKNPVPVSTEPGTLGWYYSSNNALEPMTPTTSYPYGRSYTPPGPDPTTSTSAGPGNDYKMGSGHEVTSERLKIAIGELDHYYIIRQHFVSTPNTFNPNLLSHVSTSSTTNFSANGTTSISSANNRITVSSAQTNVSPRPGAYPIGGTITVTPGKSYTFKVKGYKTSTKAVNLYVANAAGGNIVWPGAVMPTGGSTKENWVSTMFTVPAGVTAIRVGVLWNVAPSNDNFTITAVDLRADNPIASTGYKYISTDPNGKKAVGFVDADGRSIASATLTGTSTYDNWSYTYYNDLGQVVATVAPNGVVNGTAKPQFVTYYSYDHLGRLIETISPDEGKTQFVYSTDGKIRFSQNEEQRNAPEKKFSYTNYDYLGRLIESGEYTIKTVSGKPASYTFEPHSSMATPRPATSILNLVDNIGFSGVSKSNSDHESRCSDFNIIEYDFKSRVTETQNEIASTVYSYDEFGQVVKTVQTIPDLGAKTIEYKYDYFGNVTEVAYQKGVTNDDFYHYYEYDKEQRLTKVYTSTDGTTKTQRTAYYYYLHGPLKRVELGDNLQGIDYVYNIDGSLKLINHADPARDPGQDGLSGANAGFRKDIFGEVLDYNTNDYTGAGYDEGNLTLSGYNDQFSGAVKAIRWHSVVDSNVPRTYAFNYDNLYQLDNAQWGNMTGASGSYGFSPSATQSYQEDIGKATGSPYDKNGNIQGLIRKGKTGNTLASYSYNYQANTNKLTSITPQAGGNAILSYEYNDIGQMTQQVEGSKYHESQL